MFQRLVSVYKALIIQQPYLTWGLVLMATAALALGLPNFKLDASADSLTLEHDTDLDYFREINKRYQSGDFLVVTYTPKAYLFSDAALGTLQKLREQLLAVEGVASSNSILDLPLLNSPRQTLTEIASQPRTLLTPGVDRELAKKEFLNSPIYRNLVLSPDAKTTALLLNIKVDNRYIELVRRRDALRLKRDRTGLDSEEAAKLERVSKEFLDYRTAAEARAHERVDEIRAIVDKYRDEAEMFIGGVSMITADMVDFIRSDLVVFGSGIFIFIIVTLAVIFRQLRFVVMPLLICVIAVVMMLGYLSWVDWRLTVISSNFVALLLIVTLAIAIHLIVRYREFHAANPDWPRRRLVWETVRFMARPCLYTALTTMVAFASLVVSDIRPVMDFGWIMTIGLSLALLLTFLLLPAALMILPKGEPRDRGDKSHTLTLRFSRFTEHYGGMVLGISAVTAVVSIFGISELKVDNRFIDYFHKSTEIYQGLEVIDKRLGGTTTLDIILDVDPESLAAEQEYTALEDDPFAEADPFDEPDPFEEPEPLAEEDPFAESDPFSEKNPDSELQKSYWFTVAGLEEVEELHDYLESLPEVGKVQSLAIAYKVGRQLNGGQLNDFELALIRKKLPPMVKDVLLTPYLAENTNQTRISLRVKETSPELDRMTLPAKIRRHAVDKLGMKEKQLHFTGMLVLYNNMLQSLFRSQIVTIGAVFLGIMAMFVVLFRSLLLAVIAIIPNMLAAAVVLGGMGLAGIPLDMMTITIAAIAVGIGVDHAIHYIHRYRREFQFDASYVQSMHRSHASIGRAMFYTSITIIVGFSILSLSQFIPSIYFGLLTGVAMLAAILGSLTLLPKLILVIKPLGPENSGTEVLSESHAA